MDESNYFLHTDNEEVGSSCLTAPGSAGRFKLSSGYWPCGVSPVLTASASRLSGVLAPPKNILVFPSRVYSCLAVRHSWDRLLIHSPVLGLLQWQDVVLEGCFDFKRIFIYYGLHVLAQRIRSKFILWSPPAQSSPCVVCPQVTHEHQRFSSRWFSCPVLILGTVFLLHWYQ